MAEEKRTEKKEKGIRGTRTLRSRPVPPREKIKKENHEKQRGYTFRSLRLRFRTASNQDTKLRHDRPEDFAILLLSLPNAKKRKIKDCIHVRYLTQKLYSKNAFDVLKLR